MSWKALALKLLDLWERGLLQHHDCSLVEQQREVEETFRLIREKEKP